MSSNSRFRCPMLWGVAFSGCLAASLNAGDSDLDEAIRKHRMGTLVVQAAPGAEVRVEQLRHEFWFGEALASQMFSGRSGNDDAARYKRLFLENFNAAVTENALKWHAIQSPRADRLLSDLLCESGGRRHLDVGILGRRQLDSRLVPVPA